MSAAVWSESCGRGHDPHQRLGGEVSISRDDLPGLPPPPPLPGAMDLKVYGVTSDGLRYALPLEPFSGWRPGMCPVEGCDCGGRDA